MGYTHLKIGKVFFEFIYFFNCMQKRCEQSEIQKLNYLWQWRLMLRNFWHSLFWNELPFLAQASR